MKCSSHVKTTNGIAAVALSAALAFGCFSFTEPAYAVTAAQKAAEAEEALAQLNAMQETLDQASEAYVQALQDYEQAATKRDETRARIDELNGQISEIQGRLGDRAREMYRSGNTSFIDLLLGSASFDEFAQNWDLLNRVNETDADMSVQVKGLRGEAQEQEVQYAEQAQVAEQKSKEAAEAFEQAQVLVEQMQATYDSLSAEAMELYAQEQAAAAASYATQGGYVNDDGTVTDIQTGKTYSSTSAYVAATGNAIVDRARAMIGQRYVWGGVGGSDGGFDCSGLVSYAISGTNTRLGTSASFGQTYSRVAGTPQDGDLYVTNGHVAVYSASTNTLIHAVDTDTGVAETPFKEKSDGFFVRVS